MSRVDAIRDRILSLVPAPSAAVTRAIAAEFGVTRQAVSHHVKALINAGMLDASGQTRARILMPKRRPLGEFRYRTSEVDEDRIWRRDVEPLLPGLPRNVVEIWHYAVTETVNNAIDHSQSDSIVVAVEALGHETRIHVADVGIGIFAKIQHALGLEAPEHAVLELAKGKFTTDPDNHSGEGIFFASRAVDTFSILANGLFAVHAEGSDGDWVFGEGDDSKRGTVVTMTLTDQSERRLGDVFDAYATPETDYVFAKTSVPVNLVSHGDARAVSRSQAKRLMARLERFRTVLLDFAGIDTVGQGFADEVFRVFVNANPEVEVLYTGANPEVEKMILRAKATHVRRQ